jgi:hypothetical protein
MRNQTNVPLGTRMELVAPGPSAGSLQVLPSLHHKNAGDQGS